MLRGINVRVLGATVVGVGLVCAAWWLNTLNATAQNNPAVATGIVATRSGITVTDRNRDGIEDWKEPFLTASPVILSDDVGSSSRSGTLTERAGISLMERYLLSRASGSLGESDEALVGSVSSELAAQIQEQPYDRFDVIVSTIETPASIRDYANAAALAITSSEGSQMTHELLLLQKFVQTSSPDDAAALRAKADIYRRYRDQFLALPVPASLADEHLQLVNVFNVLANDIDAFTMVEADPIRSLIHLNRYEVSVEALAQGMKAMYDALEDNAPSFSANDPGLYFANFSDIQMPVATPTP